MGVHNYRGHVYMSSLASLKSHWSSCGKTGKKLNTTPVPLGTKEGAFCTYLANKTNRAYARLEVYARLPGVKPQNIPDWRLLREHTHTHTCTHTHCNQYWHQNNWPPIKTYSKWNDEFRERLFIVKRQRHMQQPQFIKPRFKLSAPLRFLWVGNWTHPHSSWVIDSALPICQICPKHVHTGLGIHEQALKITHNYLLYTKNPETLPESNW